MDELIDKIISYSVKDFQYHIVGSWFWVVSKEKKEWVIGISQNGYTWYNHYFFNNLFNYLSLEVGDNNRHIRNWAEKNLGVKISENCHPDHLPDEYDWSDQFNLDKIMSMVE